jgi:phosphoribosylanthranilate isomerase
MAVRVKICGITRLDDALDACRAGADALGFVFHPASPRNIAPQTAAAIVARLPPFVTSVGLFVDADAAFVEAVLATANLDLLQFHGHETPAECGRFGKPYLKAVRVSPDTDLLEYAATYKTARGLLLDAYVPGVAGGTGVAFDWGLIPPELAGSIVLSGGLTPENVGEAVRRVRPWAVDVSSGVEAAKGVKDPHKVSRFIANAKAP